MRNGTHARTDESVTDLRPMPVSRHSGQKSLPDAQRNERVALRLSLSCVPCHFLYPVEPGAGWIWPYTVNMAVTTIKSTYSLDVESVRQLEGLASRWKVPKSEVLRRVIRLAAAEENLDDNSKLAALDRLQASVRERNVDLAQWARDSRTERYAGAHRLPPEPE